MTPLAKDLLSLIGTTLRAPRDAADRILALDLPREVWWQALAAVVILSMLLAQAINLLIPAPMDPFMAMFAQGPLAMVLFQGMLAVAMVFVMDRVGRAFGGQGDFDGALRLTAWLHVVMFALQLGQTLILLLLPPLANLAGIAIMVLNLWILTSFVAQLHGFRSMGAVFGMIVVTFFVVSFIFLILLNILGLGPMLPEAPDV